MKLYEVYDDTECPRCGNREGNRDHGPYEPHPLDAGLGGTPDPCVHLMTCGKCRKPFDVAPDWYIEKQLEPGGRLSGAVEQIRAELACPDCPAEVRVTFRGRVYALVVHVATCPWLSRYQAGELSMKNGDHTGAHPCGVDKVTHRGPYKRDPERRGS